ncbi:MAG TPA: hypothetical protein DHV48_09320 [Prolixibacteraceae bacterium]|nr:hypothetical protein [Prolixibacteraceae bacterium]
MKKCILLLFGAVLFVSGLYAQTTIPGNYFTADRTLTADGSPYTLTGSQNVNAGVTVTVEEGVVFKFNSGVYLRVYGTLNAKGATFTSSSETPSKGSWNGLRIEASGSTSGNINLESCLVEYAVYILDINGQLTLKKCTLNNFSDHAVHVYTEGTLDISETTIKNSNNHPIYLNGPGMLKGTNDNVLTGNAADYIYLNFNDVSGVFNIPKFDIPYRLTTFRVTETGTLNISPGVELKSYNSEITIRGKVKARGTSDKPIIFDWHPGSSYWLGINITPSAIDSACIFQNCIFKNAKYDNDAYVAMAVDGASPTFENCLFTDNHRNLFVTGISQPLFTNCKFYPSTIVGAEAYNVAIDMNANVDFSTDSIKFNAKEIRAVRILPSTVIDDARLKKLSFKNIENISYCLYETTTVHDTASLVIDPGVVIKCRQYNSMITANGTLTGIGTESEPIIFTHIADDNFGNPLDSENNGQAGISNSNSGRIAIYGNSTSKIKYWKIYYGGYNSDNWAVYVSKGNIVENCEIKNSYRGIYFYDNAQLLNNAFLNINYYPLGRYVNQGSPTLIGNTVSNVGYIGIFIPGIAADSPTLQSLDFAGFTNVAYLIDDNRTIAAGNVLTINPGVVIKFYQAGRFTVNGAIKAIGNKNNKIIFTSYLDDSASGDSNNNGTASTPGNGDWAGFDYGGSASDTENILKNCELRYCGEWYVSRNAVIHITDCKVAIDSVMINFTNKCALGIYGNANPVISNSEFYNLGNAPIHMDMFSNPTFSENNKVANLPRIGLLVRGGTINGTVPERSFAGYNNITYIIEEALTVSSQLTIPAGLTFKGNSVWHIRGKLDIQGIAGNPVVFTTLEDDLYGNPKDLQQNGTTTPGNNGNYFIFYDESNDLSTIDHALFRYTRTVPIQTSNASPKILNSTFGNFPYEGISLAGSSAPTIKDCTFSNITFPFTTSLVTYPAETTGNTISGTTGRAIRVTNETLTQNATLLKRDFAGITNIPYVFQNYSIGSGAILTINPGIVCKFMSGGYLNVYKGLMAIGGASTDNTIVFTADRDDFYGGDTYGDGDANQPNTYYWRGINFLNESIDASCKLENCIIKNASDYYYDPNYSGYDPYRYGAITLDNASPTIKDCLFESNYYGILARNTSLPTITNCDFVGTNPTYGYGVWNMTSTNTVTAKGCWWNHNTGPRNASNPGGLGERVSNYVDFTPWATQLAKPVLGDVSMNGEVKPFDASLVLQHAVAAIVLTDKQQGVADVSGNGMISSYDASLILQYSVGLISRFEPEPDGTKSATINEYAVISFPDNISEYAKKTFQLPVTISTSKGIKALDMKYTINKDHIRFVQISKANLPSGISLEAGFNSKNSEIAISMASAYDLNFNNQQIILEFEFTESGLSESQFDLVAAMANDYIISDNLGTATINSKSDVTWAGKNPELTEPQVFNDQYAIHAKFELAKANQNLDIQVVDLTGRILYKQSLKNLSSGLQQIDLYYSDFDRPGKGIYILNLRAEKFSYSKKLLIK